MGDWTLVSVTLAAGCFILAFLWFMLDHDYEPLDDEDEDDD